MEKTIIIFANSVKRHKHCVAGKDIKTKEWIRPINLGNNEYELDSKDCICEGLASPVSLLQIISINLNEHKPLIYQPENYVISKEKWKYINSINREKAEDYIDNPDYLWTNTNYQNDRINYESIERREIKIDYSLYLIKVNKIHVYLKDRSQWGRPPQRRGKFVYNNIEYDLALTDPQFTELEKQDLFDKFLCISLGGEFNGFCYKIIASIF